MLIQATTRCVKTKTQQDKLRKESAGSSLFSLLVICIPSRYLLFFLNKIQHTAVPFSFQVGVIDQIQPVFVDTDSKNTKTNFIRQK